MKKNLIALASALALAGCSTSGPQLMGGYTDYRKPTTEEKALFQSTYRGGVPLTPKKVATQVVAGTNYSFICKDDKNGTHKVVIYKPLPGQGEASVSSVDKQ